MKLDNKSTARLIAVVKQVFNLKGSPAGNSVKREYCNARHMIVGLLSEAGMGSADIQKATGIKLSTSVGYARRKFALLKDLDHAFKANLKTVTTILEHEAD